MGGISMTQLLIVLLVVVLVFGTKKLRNIGNDLGSAVKGFKKGLAEDDPKELDHNGETAQSQESHKESVEK